MVWEIKSPNKKDRTLSLLQKIMAKWTLERCNQIRGWVSYWSSLCKLFLYNKNNLVLQTSWWTALFNNPEAHKSNPHFLTNLLHHNSNNKGLRLSLRYRSRTHNSRTSNIRQASNFFNKNSSISLLPSSSTCLRMAPISLIKRHQLNYSFHLPQQRPKKNKKAPSLCSKMFIRNSK